MNFYIKKMLESAPYLWEQFFNWYITQIYISLTSAEKLLKFFCPIFENSHLHHQKQPAEVFTESLLKETLAQLFSFDFCEFFKNTFFKRKPLVAASGSWIVWNRGSIYLGKSRSSIDLSATYNSDSFRSSRSHIFSK